MVGYRKQVAPLRVCLTSRRVVIPHTRQSARGVTSMGVGGEPNQIQISKSNKYCDALRKAKKERDLPFSRSQRSRAASNAVSDGEYVGLSRGPRFAGCRRFGRIRRRCVWAFSLSTSTRTPDHPCNPERGLFAQSF